MTTSIRMDERLMLRLKRYAQTHDISASNVVREALTLYLDGRQQDAYELGADLFGRHRSGDVETARSVERKSRVRNRIHAQYARK